MTGPWNFRQWQTVGLPIALFLVLFVAILGVRPLFIPDEVRYGEIAREMLASGNWIVPRLNGLLYFEKPPLGHWINAASLWLFGESPFAVRLGGAFAAGIGALIAFRLARATTAAVATASLAAVVYLTTAEVQLIGTFSVLDSFFAMLVNAGIAVFAMAAWADNRRRWLRLLLAGVLFGGAVLTKGLLGFAIPFLVLVPWLLLIRQWRLLFVQSWLTLAVAVAVVLPWALAIHHAQPDFWRYFFWVEHIQRFASAQAQHKAPVYFFLVFLPVVAFPWVFLWPATVRGLRQAARDRAVREGSIELLALWAAMPFLLFSIASGKLITYILPCFLPLSLLVATGLASVRDKHSWQRRGIACVVALLTVLLLALLVVYLLMPQVTIYADGETGRFVVLAAALCGSIVLCTVASRVQQPQHGRLLLGIAMAALLAPMPWVVPAATLSLKAPVDFIRAVYAHAPVGSAVVSNGSFIRAVTWTTHRTDVYGVDDKGETAYGFDAPDGLGRFLDSAAFGALLKSGRSVLLFCKGRCETKTLDQLPADTESWKYGAFDAYLVSGSKDWQTGASRKRCCGMAARPAPNNGQLANGREPVVVPMVPFER